MFKVNSKERLSTNLKTTLKEIRNKEVANNVE